ncbi:MAG: hypothetical protein R3F60_27320 [bacterium]
MVATGSHPVDQPPTLVRLALPTASAVAQKWLVAQVVGAAWLDFSR